MRLSIAALTPWLAGCATATGLRHAPLAQGDVLHFSAPFDSVVVTAERATRRVGLDVAESERVDSVTWRVVASKGLSGNLIFGPQFGEVVRVVIAQQPADLVAVHILSKPKAALAGGSTDWTAPIFHELERDLGQQTLRVVPGSRVRLSLSGQIVGGTLLGLTPDTLVLKETGPVALASVTGLEVRRGSRSHTRAGMAVGVLLGAVIGAVVGQASQDPNCGQGFNFCFGALTGAAVGIVAGAVIGGAIGAGTRTDRWWTVPPPHRP